MANEEHVRMLQQGHNVWNTWRRQNPGVRPDLRGAMLYSADLTMAFLSGADISDADLRAANLRGADLSGADLSGADLRRAYLSEACFERTRLREAKL